jgi:Fe-S oxidoreductase
MKTLKSHTEDLTLCTYCPSLCRHACPIASAEGRDTVSPWGLMSVAGHIAEKRIRLSDALGEILYHCTGCGACTDACRHGVPVAATLVDARAEVVARGRAPVEAEAFVHRFERAVDGKRTTGHAKTPAILVLPGHRDVPPDGDEVRTLLKLAERLGESELGISPTSWLDTGASLWQAGYREGFRRFSARMREELARSRHVVVISSEAATTLREVYPREGARVDAEVLHVAEFLLPLLYGDAVRRLEGRYGFMRSCRLRAPTGRVDVQTELLSRVLESDPVDLMALGSEYGCCGGGGCLPQIAPSVTQATAGAMIRRALDSGIERLVTFSPECSVALRAAAQDQLEILSVIELVDRAVPGRGS